MNLTTLITFDLPTARPSRVEYHYDRSTMQCQVWCNIFYPFGKEMGFSEGTYITTLDWRPHNDFVEQPEVLAQEHFNTNYANNTVPLCMADPNGDI